MAEKVMNHIGDLTPDHRNARKHTERNIGMIEKSLEKFGAARSIVVDETGRILAGNGLIEAAANIGIERVKTVEADGNEIIAVVRRGLTEEQKLGLAVADNRAAELADWDTGMLKGLVDDGVDLAPFWTADELAAMWPQTVDLLTDEDDVPPVPVEPVSKLGDLYIMGDHRLLCGDCRDFSHVSALMAGSKINVAVTSPPYASQRKYDETSGFKPIPPDEYVAWYRDVAENIKTFLSDDGSYFCNIKEHCEDGQRSLYVKDLTLAHVREWGWRFVDEFVWKKNGVPGSWPNRFRNDFEPVFHFSTGSSIKFKPSCVGCESDHAMLSGERSTSHSTDAKFSRSKKTGQGTILPGNVLSIGCETAGDHSAPFPVALPEFFIKAFSDSQDVIFDPFMGSGTTLMAAEKNGRIAYGTELSPAYCDVIVTRWEQATGKKAVLSAG